MHSFLKFIFGIKFYMFRTVPLSIIRVQHCTHSNGTCHKRLLTARKLSANLYDIPLLCLEWKTPDNGQRNSLKHVEFYFKNKFEKLVYLVGFIIRIYHDARSAERQKCGTNGNVIYFVKMSDRTFYSLNLQTASFRCLVLDAGARWYWHIMHGISQPHDTAKRAEFGETERERES